MQTVSLHGSGTSAQYVSDSFCEHGRASGGSGDAVGFGVGDVVGT